MGERRGEEGEEGERKCRVALMHAHMQDNGWIDLQTRGVFIEFSCYNGNLNIFGLFKVRSARRREGIGCQAIESDGEAMVVANSERCQISFEFLPSGGVHPSYEFRALNLNLYDGENGDVTIAFAVWLRFGSEGPP